MTNTEVLSQLKPNEKLNQGGLSAYRVKRRRQEIQPSDKPAEGGEVKDRGGLPLRSSKRQWVRSQKENYIREEKGAYILSPRPTKKKKQKKKEKKNQKEGGGTQRVPMDHVRRQQFQWTKRGLTTE